MLTNKLKHFYLRLSVYLKAILIPSCEFPTCTLREAIIIGSIFTKCSIPVVHSGAAMLKLAAIEYNGSSSCDSYWTRNTPCPSVFWMPWSATSCSSAVAPKSAHHGAALQGRPGLGTLGCSAGAAQIADTRSQISAEIRRELQNSVP
ncbi:unnamed protein product [Oncorhynchus mykiss]|uniref:Uncharacterized protein n=1 Tax=Oncorhynchus mykiss TaxID=8022 RepID=A0A060WA17_ONCMY|nr:unnamed protein product [Oncorhynchus mykiss]